MYKLQLLNKKNKYDIVTSKEGTQEEIEVKYNQIKNSMIANPKKIIRIANKELEQDQITYQDIKMYIFDDNDNEVSRFYV